MIGLYTVVWSSNNGSSNSIAPLLLCRETARPGPCLSRGQKELANLLESKCISALRARSSSMITAPEGRTIMTSTYSGTAYQPPIYTSNVRRFYALADQTRRTELTPSTISVVSGAPGTGKTTAARLYLAD